MTDDEEKAYVRGHAMAMSAVLGFAIRELQGDGSQVNLAHLIKERQEAIAVLRGLCEEHGDNDWKDDDHLADIIDKHLGRYLLQAGGR